MPPDERPISPRARLRLRRWLLAAGLMQGVAMLLVMSSLLRLTPLTLTFSVGGGGLLLTIACGIYVVSVAHDLRRRRIL